MSGVREICLAAMICYDGGRNWAWPWLLYSTLPDSASDCLSMYVDKSVDSGARSLIHGKGPLVVTIEDKMCEAISNIVA